MLAGNWKTSRMVAHYRDSGLDDCPSGSVHVKSYRMPTALTRIIQEGSLASGPSADGGDGETVGSAGAALARTI